MGQNELSKAVDSAIAKVLSIVRGKLSDADIQSIKAAIAEIKSLSARNLV